MGIDHILLTHHIAFLLTSRYGIDLKEEDIEEVRAIADSEGEVIVGKEGAHEIPQYRMGVKKHHNMSLESVCHAPKDYLHLDFFLHRFERMTSSSTSSSPT